MSAQNLLQDSIKQSILIVDDKPNNLRLLSTLLEGYDYEIFVALSGEQALQRMDFVIPDLIIMDVMMPGIDGFETCRRLKANEKTKNIPVIFMTALSGTKDMLQGFEAGGIDYITKPIQQSEALARIEVHLRESKLAKQLQLANKDLQQEVDRRQEVENQLIKHQKQLEELVQELAEAKDHAELANQAKSDFLASMSHELRTPLNAILGYTQVLRNRPLDSETLDNIRTIHQSGEHLLTLINDSLDIAKIEAGKMVLEEDWLHLPAFLQGLVSIIHSRAKTKDLSFEFDVSALLPTSIKADETRLRQVLLNLLGNAVKFTKQGSVTLRVHEGNNEETAVSPPQQSIIFEIEDTGVGLTDEDLTRIFLPYEQAGSTSSRHKGTGLGLSISQQLIQMMGGTLQVTSTFGKGSTFSFEVTFPISEMAVEKAERKAAVPVGYYGPSRSVLIVDDIASNRLVLKAMLRPLGLDTFEAKNGQDALDLADTQQPDLILMDRWMPEMDGLTAITNLRNRGNFKETPIIAVSASIGKDDKAQFKKAGASDFLPKPIALPNLIKMLQKHLQLEWQYKENDLVESNTRTERSSAK